MVYRIKMMVYHQDESVKDSRGVEFECDLDPSLNVRQHIVRGMLEEDQFVKSLYVEPVQCQ